MAENKTTETGADVTAYLDAVPPEARREAARTLASLMQRVSGSQLAMWGPSIVGFGRYHYRYDSGREGDAPRTGFSARKAALTLYLTTGFAMREDLLARLGKHGQGKGCLYIKKLSDVDVAVLEELIASSLADMAERYPA